MKAELCTICSDVISEVSSGLVSIVKIYETITCQKFPMVVPMLCFFVQLKRSSLEPDMFIGSVAIKQGGKTETTIPVSGNFQDKTKCNLTLKFEGFHIVRKGDLEIVLSDGNKEIASAKVEVKADIPLIKQPGDGSGVVIM